MLSRVADSLYWMSRYMERVEDVARMLEANLLVMHDMSSAEGSRLRENWKPLISCLGLEEPFEKRGCALGADAVLEFLVFDAESSHSMVSVLRMARENARAVREQISNEMWEQINRMYLWITSRQSKALYQKNPYDFFSHITHQSALFEGVTASSLMHDEGWDFIQIGKHIERADKTSRVLDDKFHLIGAENELLQSITALRSCSARQAYQRVYVSEVTPKRVAELLLINRSFPRSIAYCARAADQALRRISGVREGGFSNDAEKVSGRLVSEICFSRIEDFWKPGLHETMDWIQQQLNQLHACLLDAYIFQKQLMAPIIPREPGQ